MFFFIHARIEDCGFYQPLSPNPELPNFVMIYLNTALLFYKCLCEYIVPIVLVVFLYKFIFQCISLFLNLIIYMVEHNFPEKCKHLIIV